MKLTFKKHKSFANTQLLFRIAKFKTKFHIIKKKNSGTTASSPITGIIAGFCFAIEV